eukprot:357949-Chlamydomonas_euryale.AAC.2
MRTATRGAARLENPRPTLASPTAASRGSSLDAGAACAPRVMALLLCSLDRRYLLGEKPALAVRFIVGGFGDLPAHRLQSLAGVHSKFIIWQDHERRHVVKHATLHAARTKPACASRARPTGSALPGTECVYSRAGAASLTADRTFARRSVKGAFELAVPHELDVWKAAGANVSRYSTATLSNISPPLRTTFLCNGRCGKGALFDRDNLSLSHAVTPLLDQPPAWRHAEGTAVLKLNVRRCPGSTAAVAATAHPRPCKPPCARRLRRAAVSPHAPAPAPAPHLVRG